jgi:hypothetical protein
MRRPWLPDLVAPLDASVRATRAFDFQSGSARLALTSSVANSAHHHASDGALRGAPCQVTPCGTHWITSSSERVAPPPCFPAGERSEHLGAYRLSPGRATPPQLHPISAARSAAYCA